MQKYLPYLMIVAIILLLIYPTWALGETNLVKLNAKLDDNAKCYIQNAYWEARGEGHMGIRGVIDVTYNRVLDKRFPSSACEVVWQRAQFSWTLGTVKNFDIPTPEAADDLRALSEIVSLVLSYRDGSRHPLSTATHFVAPQGLTLDASGQRVYPEWLRCERHTGRQCVSVDGQNLLSPLYIQGGHWFFTM